MCIMVPSAKRSTDVIPRDLVSFMGRVLSAAGGKEAEVRKGGSRSSCTVSTGLQLPVWAWLGSWHSIPSVLVDALKYGDLRACQHLSWKG